MSYSSWITVVLSRIEGLRKAELSLCSHRAEIFARNIEVSRRYKQQEEENRPRHEAMQRIRTERDEEQSRKDWEK